MTEHSEEMVKVRERIADRLFGQIHGQGITSPLLLADAVLDALGLEQVGWLVLEEPDDFDSWIAVVDLDFEALDHYPHRPLFTAIPPSVSGSSGSGGKEEDG